MARIDRYRGPLLGLAAGDALGMTLEFRQPGAFTPISGMVGGGPFGLRPGEWTDGTSLALCLAESLIEKRRFDPVDQLERYVRWYREGHLSSTGTCFDIGTTTPRALERFTLTCEPYAGLTDERSAGNELLMRHSRSFSQERHPTKITQQLSAALELPVAYLRPAVTLSPLKFSPRLRLPASRIRRPIRPLHGSGSRSPALREPSSTAPRARRS